MLVVSEEGWSLQGMNVSGSVNLINLQLQVIYPCIY
nr:MAG TPA: hypothetical protein [Caudoviricetes sp.]